MQLWEGQKKAEDRRWDCLVNAPTVCGFAKTRTVCLVGGFLFVKAEWRSEQPLLQCVVFALNGRDAPC